MNLFNDLRRGKLFGHPIHVILIHFPAGLLPVAAALDAIRALGWLPIPDVSQLFLWPGVAFGWIAAMFGLWDLVRLPAGSRELSHALLHAGTNALAISGFTAALLIAIVTPASQIVRLWIEIASAITLLFGNKFGGDLVFWLGVGQATKS